MRERARSALLVAIRTTTAAAGLATVFSLSATAALLLHASLPPSRRAVLRIALDAVNRSITGSITAESLDRVGLTHLELRGVTILDGGGKTVIKGDHVKARVASVRLLGTLLSSAGNIEVRIPWVRVDHADVTLEQGPDGVLTIARAFELRPRPPPKGPPGPPARPIVVDLPYIEIGSAYAQGKLAPVGEIDAETRMLHGAVRVGPEGVSVDTQRAAVAVRKPVPLPVMGSAEFHLRSPGAVWAYFAGLAGDIELTSAARLDGRTVDVTMDVPAIRGSTVSAWVPGTQVMQTVSARLEAHGTLPALSTALTVRMGETYLDARGPVDTTAGTGAWEVELRDLDLRSVVAQAPFTQLGADARVEVAAGPDGAPRATLHGKVLPGLVASHRLPEADFQATVDKAGVSGRAQVHEPGIPVVADFGVTREGAVTVKATSTIASLQAAPRLGGVLNGSADARLEARIDKGELDLVVGADLRGVGRGPIRLGAGRLNAHAWGKPAELLVDASVTGTGVHVGMLTWQDATAVLRGPVRTPHVTLSLRDDAGPSVRSKAQLSFVRQFVARDLQVEVGRGTKGFSLSAESVDVRNGTVDFGGIAIDGLGSPIDGVVKLGPNSFDVRLVSSGVDLATLSSVLAVPGLSLGGKAAIDIDVRNVGAESTGCARIDVRDGRYDMLSGIEASVRARFSGSRVEFDSNVALGAERSGPEAAAQPGVCLPAAPVGTGALADARATGDLVLDGSPMRALSWSQATGTARLTRMGIDLGRIAQMAWIARRIAPGLGIPELDGTLTIKAEASRVRPAEALGWAVTASTHKFKLTSKDTAIADADLVVSASMEPTGVLHTGLCARKPSDVAAASCEQGDRYFVAQGRTELDYHRLLREPSAWKQLLENAKTRAHLVVPERAVSELLAPVMKTDDLPLHSRRVAALVELNGTWLAPNVALSGYLDRPEIQGEVLPALVCLSGGWDGSRGSSQAWLRRRASSEGSVAGLCSQAQGGTDASQRVREPESVGLVQTSFLARWQDVLGARKASEIPFEADATFAIDNLPLSDLGGSMVSGAVSGRGGIKGLGKKPEFAVDLQLQGLRVGPEFAYDRGSLAVRSDAAGLRGTLVLIDQTGTREQGTPGRLDAEVNSAQPVAFAGGWVPGLNHGQEVKLKVKPSRFRVASLLPFLEPTLSYLDGDLSGFVDATWVKGGKGSRIDDAFLFLSDGGFQIPTVGQEFIGVSATLRTQAANRLVVEGFRANAVSGQLTGSASIGLDELRIATISAAVGTNKQNKLRLTIEGIPIGDVYGQVYADVRLGAARNEVLVRGSGLHVELSEADQRKVQSLDAHPEVAVVPSADVVTTGQGWTQVVRAPVSRAGITPWHVTLNLLDPMQIERSGMRFSINTLPGGKDPPTIDYPSPSSSGPSMAGKVRLEQGRVDVLGKFFVIDPERSVVTFNGEVNNTELSVTARWDATDGTRVYADVTGTIKEPHVQLRSEPARPPSEILAMLLFGGASDPVATRTDPGARTGGGSAAAAAGVGSGVAAAGINKLLSDVAPMGISTRIDTSQQRNVRPTVVIEVANNVTAEATVNTGTVPLGQNPDRYLLTLDWRFLRSWSMRTTVGDAGSSILDVLWTHRY